jgi:hypothetical protein
MDPAGVPVRRFPSIQSKNQNHKSQQTPPPTNTPRTPIGTPPKPSHIYTYIYTTVAIFHPSFHFANMSHLFRHNNNAAFLQKQQQQQLGAATMRTVTRNEPPPPLPIVNDPSSNINSSNGSSPNTIESLQVRNRFHLQVQHLLLSTPPSHSSSGRLLYPWRLVNSKPTRDVHTTTTTSDAEETMTM